jgi:Rha family phage regulatory protein
MEELVYKSEKGTPVTNSLLVAQKFGKEHKDVLDAIRNLTAENSAVKSLFYETTYISDRNREYPVFIMNRDGFSLLVMGFTGKEALNFKLDFIEAFNKMDDMLKSEDYILARSQEILQNRIALAAQKIQILEGENELLTNEVKQLAPKAEYTDKVLQSVSTCTMTQIAKELGMSAIALEKKLHEKGIIFRQSGQWILYSKYQNKGYARSRTHQYTRSDGSTGTNTITVWTEKGRKFIHGEMNEAVKRREPETVSY